MGKKRGEGGRLGEKECVGGVARGVLVLLWALLRTGKAEAKRTGGKREKREERGESAD
jgi:hypothetical protein